MREPKIARIPWTARLAALFVGLIVASIAEGQTAPAPATKPDAPKAVEKTKTKPKAATVKKAKPGDDQPLVMSTEALAKLRGKPIDQERYDNEPDWSGIPPWRQSSFFGIKAKGQLFIYVVDCSGSMDDQDRLDRAKAELRRSVNALQSPQRFKVIFYNDRPVPMPGELPRAADYPSKSQLANWLNLVEAGGETDPRSSLSLALALRPDAIFLLSDGAFPEGTVESVARLNPKKVPIHCVDLGDGAAGNGLRKIASESGGQYVARGR